MSIVLILEVEGDAQSRCTCRVDHEGTCMEGKGQCAEVDRGKDGKTGSLFSLYTSIIPL